MRLLPALLLAAVLAAALAFLLLRGNGEGEPPPPPDDAAPQDPAQAELDANPHLLIKTGSLVIRISAPDGSVPDGAEVGYVHRGRLRLLYAGPDGRRQFGDAPLGELEIVARAPGYAEVRSVRRLSAGVPEEVRLVLQPEGQ